MNLSDLLVSYKQVSEPFFYQEPDIEPTTTDINWDRVKSLDLEDNTPKFTGIFNPQELVPQDETPSNNDIVQFFMNKGLSKNQAQGIYGNIMQVVGLLLKTRLLQNIQPYFQRNLQKIIY